MLEKLGGHFFHVIIPIFETQELLIQIRYEFLTIRTAFEMIERFHYVSSSNFFQSINKGSLHPYEKEFIFLKMHNTCIFTEFNSCRKKTPQFVQVNVTRLKSKARENVHNLRGKQFLGRYIGSIGRGLLSLPPL